jgi:hypothetical protein
MPPAQPDAGFPPVPDPDPCEVSAWPEIPRVPLRRLTVPEYDSAAQWLTGTTSEPLVEAQFRDPEHHGFANNAEVLGMDPSLVERLSVSAERLAAEIGRRELDRGFVRRFELETRQQDGGPNTVQQTCCGADMWNDLTECASGVCTRLFHGNYRVRVNATIDQPGEWSIVLRAQPLPFVLADLLSSDGGLRTDAGLLADGGFELVPTVFHVAIDGRDFPLPFSPGDRSAQSLVLNVPPDALESPGIHEIAAILNVLTPMTRPSAKADYLELRRASTSVPVSERRVVQCELDGPTGLLCLRQSLDAFARRAFRHTPSQSELARIHQVVDDSLAAGDDRSAAMRLGVEAVLFSPAFLFRIEGASSSAPSRLSGTSLATRLAGALWGTVPDDALITAAESGVLDSEQGLRATIDAMLTSPRAAALRREFGGRWLGVPLARAASLDPAAFPDFTQPVQEAMAQEIELSFGHLLEAGAPIRELVDPRATYVNDELARHYGLPLPSRSTPVRMTLSDQRRGGALAWGGLLAFNSRPEKPSPTRRGHWVAAQLLCEAPPPPPPDVPGLPNSTAQTTRQILEEHARNPACSGCHSLMDPIGFGLENYDADGRWRTAEHGLPINSTGRLPDGRAFSGPLELKGLLAGDERVSACATQQFYGYALNRSVQPADRCHLRALQRDGSDTMPSLIRRVLTAPSFTQFRSEPP